MCLRSSSGRAPTGTCSCNPRRLRARERNVSRFVLMVTRLLAALCLMALCVTIHAAGLSWALLWLRRHPAQIQRFWFDTWLFVLVAAWMVLLHLLEIAGWAAFYFWKRALG